ncbi:sodium/potassium/calcium exchanger 1-like [Antennarius striatus]|uniref:sodium/potassium/calcium exchanger 1-like n=1 Tax=Antennarius striatus TaxID=241820 RepID=UPI0035AF4AD9
MKAPSSGPGPVLLSGVFLSLLQLTISARPHKPLWMPQIGEDFGNGSLEAVKDPTVETQGLGGFLSGANKFKPTNQTRPQTHLVHQINRTSDLKASITTELRPPTATYCTDVHCISVAPDPPLETPTPAPAPPGISITPAVPGEAPHVKGEYPEDFFTIEDRRRGWVILHIIGMIYMFISLAIVCDEYFVPALGVITNKLAISDDVAGATFMAAGRSIPKLFAVLIGTCVSPITVGIGSIVGPAVYNILFVIGTCALFSRQTLYLTWWPLFRDFSFYIVDLLLFILFFLDNMIMWWESMMLVIGYTLYVIFMKFNVQLERAFKTQLYKHKNIVKVIALEEPEKETSAENQPGALEYAESSEDGIDQDSCKNYKVEMSKGAIEENEMNGKPVSLVWPDSRHKQATYLFLLPIIFPLWLTVPDVRKQKSRKFFAVTFLGSIVWIAVFSYLMVWWAHQVGETIGISEEIMGLTILAAGTSIPDLITSVTVARKGLGDMVVSSSVGSNIFNITVCLPVPWLLYSAIHGMAPVAVSSNGIFCAIVLLFIMLLFVIISVASCKWKMNKALGFTMFLLYFIFLVLSVMLKNHIIVCPVSV